MPFVDQLLDRYAAEGKPMLVTKFLKAADGFTPGLPLLTQRGQGLRQALRLGC
jgi:hypothetical protein